MSYHCVSMTPNFFPVNILGFCKCLKGNIWQRLKRGWIQEPFTIECFKNILCIPFIKRVTTNVRKNVTNEHNNVSIIMGSEVKFNIF